MIRYIFLLMFLSFLNVAEAGAQLLFVPIDDRPVCLDYTVAAFKAAGFEIKTPPGNLIASFDHGGDPDGLYAWLAANAPTADAVVVSSDSLIYGGLVQSRTHKIPQDVLMERADRLLGLKKKFWNLSVYIFTSVMRSPKTSNAPVEPAYYQTYGEKIFRLGALMDKREVDGLNRKEEKERLRLVKMIPTNILNDLYSRRATNLKITKRLLAGTEDGSFDYLLLGRDDTALYSDAHRDARSLEIINKMLVQRKVRFFAGVDQLGAVLLNRAITKDTGCVPIVYTFYAEGIGGKTIPAYEDDAVGTTTRAQILAAGCWPGISDKYADLVLAVNTPVDGRTLQADTIENINKLNKKDGRFLQKVQAHIKRGKRTAIADVAYANGADNSLMTALFTKKMCWNLSAYAGWNTAANTIGFALVQGVQSKALSEKDKDNLLIVRYLEDWAYQSNVRGKIRKYLVWPRKWPDGKFTPVQKKIVENTIAEEIKTFMMPYISRDIVAKWHFSLPWNRTFEIKIDKQ